MGTIGLITRSRTTGYKTLPGTGASWWEVPKYRDLTRVEAPTVVLKAKSEGAIDFFLAGIASQRRTDHAGTPIRYSLFGVADTVDELRRLTFAAEAFCDDKSLRNLSEWLDDTVGADIEDWMENNLDARTDAPFLDKLRSEWVVYPVTSTPSSGSMPAPRMTVGRDNSDARQLLRAFTGELSRGGQGCVLFLNLAGRDEYEGFDEEPLLGLMRGAARAETLKKNSWVLRWAGLSLGKKIGIAVGMGLILTGLLHLLLRPASGNGSSAPYGKWESGSSIRPRAMDPRLTPVSVGASRPRMDRRSPVVPSTTMSRNDRG